MKISSIKFYITAFILCIYVAMFIQSCSKDSSPAEGAELNSIYNKHLPEEGAYINLFKKDLVSDSEHWDFSMSGIYNSELNANTQENGKLNYIDLEFDKVNANAVLNNFEADKSNFENKFTNIKNFGLHRSPYAGNKEGWLNYSGAPNHLVTPVKDRTILVITKDPTSNKKKIFKIKMISLYEGAILVPTPEDKSKVVYLTCDFQEISGIFD